MTFEEYVLLAEHTRKVYPQYRCGQAYYNALHTVRPDLARQVVGTDIDPFYQDEKLPAFLNWIGESW